MGIENIKNYLKSNLIKKAYTEIVREFEKNDFDSEFALRIFVDQILNNYKNLKKLVIEHKEWYKEFPQSYFNVIEDKLIKQKISIAVVITSIYHKNYEETAAFYDFLNISKSSKVRDIEIVFRTQEDILRKYAVYFYEFICKNNRKNHLVWLIRGNEAKVFNLKIALNSNAKVEVITSTTSKENIRSFEESAKKALLAVKSIFKVDKKTGITIAVENLDENAMIGGNSASLSIFMEILKELFGEKTFIDTAYMSDIDFTNNSLIGIDSTGLKLKIKLAIDLEIKNVVVAKENYSAVHEFENQINIIACEKLSELVAFNSELKKRFYLKKIKSFLFVLLILGLAISLYNPAKRSYINYVNNKEIEIDQSSEKQLQNIEEKKIEEPNVPNLKKEIVIKEKTSVLVKEEMITEKALEKASEKIENVLTEDKIELEKEQREKISEVQTENEISKELPGKIEKTDSIKEIVEEKNFEEQLEEDSKDKEIETLKVEEPKFKKEIILEPVILEKVIEKQGDAVISEDDIFITEKEPEIIVIEDTEKSKEKPDNIQKEEKIKEIEAEYFIYGIREIQEDWELFEINEKTLLSTGDGIQIFIKANQPAYLYIINKDVKGKLNILFPWNKDTGDYIIKSNKEYVLPKDFEEKSNSIDNYYYWVDDVYGKEHIYFILSLEKVELIEDAVSGYLTNGYIKKKTSNEILSWLDSNANLEGGSGVSQILYTPTGKEYSKESKKIRGQNFIIQKKSYFHK